MAKKLFIVDTISTFRMRYVIEADELTHAYDEITMNGVGSTSFEEVTQKHLGETIINGGEITKKEFKKLLETLKGDKDELSSYWMGDKLIHAIDYDK